MTNQQKELKIDFLEPENIEFFETENGFITLKLNGKDYGRVKLVRAYPLQYENEYICIDTLENEEIGIIKSLKELSENSRKYAENELKKRYYCPTVERVKTIKEKMGYFYFDVVIDGKGKNFAVKDITKSVIFGKDNRLIIFDMDGNRYLIPDFDKIEKKSRRLLEPYLY